MVMKGPMPLVLILMSVLTTGCGDSEVGRRMILPQTEQETVLPDDFSTRLNSTLLVGGRRCLGNETTEINGQVFLCQSDQWLITVDNINTCDESGTCTQVPSPSFIGKLEKISESDEDFNFWNIISIAGASPLQLQLLAHVSVRALSDGNSSEAILK